VFVRCVPGSLKGSLREKKTKERQKKKAILKRTSRKGQAT